MLDFEVEARARGEEPTLDGFLERVTLQSDQDGIAGERVTLMTVHAAKGLEFQNVILTGMEEDMFPYRSPGDMNPAELDEERRLAYVAITRARERLVMTHVARRLVFGQTRMGVPSRFLANLPPGSYESLETPRAREQRSSGGYATRGYGSGGASYGGGRPGYGSGGGRPGYGSGGAPGFGVRHGALGGARASEASAPRTAGERYVERDEVDDYASPFDDEPDAGASAAPDLGSAPDVGGGGELRRGSAVRHPKFGRGEVRKVLALGEPAVVAFFPGWGEVKVLARFLSPG